MLRKSLLIGVAMVAALLALAGTASAAIPIRVALGPVPVPSAPLQVCVGSNCVDVTTPQSVSLVVTATVSRPGLGVIPPTVLPVACPAGTRGLAVRVTPGSLGVDLDGSVTVAVTGSTPVTVPIDLTLSPGARPVTISACSG